PSRGGTQHRLAALTAILVALFLVPFGPIDAGAQTKDSGVPAATEPPPQVQSLLKLLDDPVVRQWLERQRATEVTTSIPPPSSTAQGQPMEAADGMAMNYFVTRITHVRGHIAGLAAALPDLPAEFNRAFVILQLEFQERGLIELLVLIAVFAALGFGTE